MVSQSGALTSAWLLTIVSFGWLIVGLLVVAHSLGRQKPARLYNKTKLVIYSLLIVVGIVFLVWNLSFEAGGVYFKVAQAYSADGDNRSSLGSYEEAIGLFDRTAVYYTGLGDNLLKLGAQSEARPGSLNPDLNFVRQLTSDKLANLGREDILRCAEVALLEAKQLDSLNVDAYLNLATFYEQWATLSEEGPKKLAQAEAAYQQAAILSPNRSPTYIDWAKVLVQLGRLDEARDKCRIALDIDHRAGYNVDFEINLVNSDIFDLEKNGDEAIKQLQIALTYAPLERKVEIQRSMAELLQKYPLRQTDLIMNGNFSERDGKLPLNWYTESSTVTVDSSGEKTALKLSTPVVSDKTFVNQMVPLKTGVSYNLSFEFKNRLSYGDQRIAIQVLDKDLGLLSTFPGDEGLVLPSSGDWQKASLDFTAPEGAVSAMIWLNHSGVGDVWFAAVGLQEKL